MSAREVLGQARSWLEAGRGVALATVVRTWGSAPRPVGSQLAVSERGEMVGSVSGGCVEAAVVDEALKVLRGAPPRVVSFRVTNERAWEVGLACGGALDVFVERADPGAVTGALEALSARGEAGLVLDLGAGERCTVRLEIPARLVVVGAVHIAQALTGMARLAGLEVLVVDPRVAFATEERFPGVALDRSWPDEALARARLDRRTAVVALTHDPKLDDLAVAASLRSEAFYVGALGSRKTQAALRARLVEQGFSEADLARIHGPVGLAIGAQTPGEIAASILAEVIACLRAAAR
jgi:xanthine dehydrogenase accessory factor